MHVYKILHRKFELRIFVINLEMIFQAEIVFLLRISLVY